MKGYPKPRARASWISSLKKQQRKEGNCSEMANLIWLRNSTKGGEALHVTGGRNDERSTRRETGESRPLLIERRKEKGGLSKKRGRLSA